MPGRQLVFQYACDNFVAEVHETGEGFTLWWHDFVVNDWEETYPTMAQAVVRLGILIAAGDVAEPDVARFFAGDAAQFSRSCEGLGDALAMFIDSQLEG
jgi:hypothetical protein